MTARWGMLSAAGIGRVVASAIRGSTDAEFVAVAGRDAGKAATHAAQLGVARNFGAYDELLACDEAASTWFPQQSASSAPGATSRLSRTCTNGSSP